MQLILDDNGLHKQLSPFALTRPISEIRFGILTIRETWQLVLKPYFSEITISYKTEEYLHIKYPKGNYDTEFIQVNGNIKPTKAIANAIGTLKNNSSLFVNGEKIAKKGSIEENRIDIELEPLLFIKKPWHIFQKNDKAIAIDFELLTAGKKSQEISDTNRCLGKENIFIEAGAKVEFAILNAEKENAPIYIGKDAEIMEGSIIRGPFALNNNAVVKMGAKIYGATTIGPFCKVGGEISNSIFQAYSNKGHDGFLGNSVIAEWCNLGADTNSSNLKNNYSNVKVYSYETKKIKLSDVLFCGLLMGDHSKTGINTMLNTATVVGVSANIFGAGFPAKYISSFTWGGVDKTDRFNLEKAFEVATNMMSRRKITLSEEDKAILTHISEKLA